MAFGCLIARFVVFKTEDRVRGWRHVIPPFIDVSAVLTLAGVLLARSLFRAVQSEQVMDDEGESGHAPKQSRTPQILRWIVLVVLLTSAVRIFATYVLDLTGLR